jgi:hypothetical protein
MVVGSYIWGNYNREEDAMLEALEHGVFTRHMEMLVGDACPWWTTTDLVVASRLGCGELEYRMVDDALMSYMHCIHVLM